MPDEAASARVFDDVVATVFNLVTLNDLEMPLGMVNVACQSRVKAR